MRRTLVCLPLCFALLAFGAGKGNAYKTLGARWSDGTISYYVADKRLAWPVQWAAYVWSESGADIRFVKAASRAGAQVVVVPMQLPSGSSEAGVTTYKTLGGTIVNAHVGLRLSLDPYQLALTATHEFGHVLGLGHEDAGCSIMNSWTVNDHPFKCAAPPTGTWWCRLVTADDVAGEIALYGGRPIPAKQPRYCKRGD